MGWLGTYGSSVSTIFMAVALGLGLLEPADIESKLAQGVGVFGLLLLALALFLVRRKEQSKDKL